MGKLVVQDDVDDTMKAELVLEEVYKATRADYNLRDACRVINTGNSINVDIPLITARVSGQMNVPELEEAEISSQSYSHVSAKLHKNVVHVALSKEAQVNANVDIMRMHVEDSGEEIARMENYEIADEMTTASFESTSGSDWSGSNDPFDDIMEAVAEIRKRDFNPDQIWMAPDQYSEFVSNEEVVRRLERGATAEGQITSAAGLNIRVDNELSAGDAYVIDSSAPVFVLLDGPAWISEYSDHTAFYDAYLIADFLHIETLLEDAGQKITGI